MIDTISLHSNCEHSLIVTWNDGRRSTYDLRALRMACPCAACVNEWTGEKMLRPAQVPEGVKPVRLFSVGRYAIGIAWSDGHDTGIYAHDYLRRLDSGESPSPMP
jgi:DUF971 family protein